MIASAAELEQSLAAIRELRERIEATKHAYGAALKPHIHLASYEAMLKQLLSEVEEYSTISSRKVRD
jgi:hypothetical protein